MLPQALLLLVCAALSAAQGRQRLPLNQISSFNAQTLQQTSWAIPDNTRSPLSISIALCSRSSALPRFLLTNTGNSDLLPDPIPNVPNVFEIPVQNGQGTWTGRFPSGGLLSVALSGASDLSFDIGISSIGPIHKTPSSLPVFGDSSSTQAIVFSPTFASFTIPKPTFPNYTLPDANMSQPELPANVLNISLVISPTSDALDWPQTGCFLSAQRTSVSNVNETVWARDETGFRRQWLIGGLSPSTNYTAFVIQDSTQISGPIYFSTKSSGFQCNLVHSLPFCPGVAYSIPLPSPPNGAGSYTVANLPEAVTKPFLSYMANFTTVLTTFACGRDWYSPVVGCDDCERQFRKWLCAISFTRCGEPSPDNPSGFPPSPPDPEATGFAAARITDMSGAQKVISALRPVETGDSPRNPFLPPLGSRYLMLQPCLEQCHQLDRACPPFLGIKCPKRDFNAAASYGVGYIDGVDGDKGEGFTGVAQDRYGNVWCQLI